MLDEKDLQAISQMMDTKLKPINERLDKLEEQQSETAKNVVVLMDAEFKPQFNLLAEGIQDIQEKLVPRSRVDDLEEEVKFMKSIIRQMNEDLQKLKKAQ